MREAYGKKSLVNRTTVSSCNTELREEWSLAASNHNPRPSLLDLDWRDEYKIINITHKIYTYNVNVNIECDYSRKSLVGSLSNNIHCMKYIYARGYNHPWEPLGDSLSQTHIDTHVQTSINKRIECLQFVWEQKHSVSLSLRPLAGL